MKQKDIDIHPFIPQEVLNLFENSYVKWDPSKSGNKYSVSRNKPTIWSDPYGVDVPLFHELGHFVLAPLDRLRITDYNFAFPYEGDKWPDLECELKVTAIEYNLLKHFKIQKEWNKLGKRSKKGFSFGLKLQSNGSEESIEIWDFLYGWENYRKHFKLTKSQMRTRMHRKFKTHVKKYNYKWFLKEWNHRNKLLVSGKV